MHGKWFQFEAMDRTFRAVARPGCAVSDMRVYGQEVLRARHLSMGQIAALEEAWRGGNPSATLDDLAEPSPDQAVAPVALRCARCPCIRARTPPNTRLATRNPLRQVLVFPHSRHRRLNQGSACQLEHWAVAPTATVAKGRAQTGHEATFVVEGEGVKLQE